MKPSFVVISQKIMIDKVMTDEVEAAAHEINLKTPIGFLFQKHLNPRDLESVFNKILPKAQLNVNVVIFKEPGTSQDKNSTELSKLCEEVGIKGTSVTFSSNRTAAAYQVLDEIGVIIITSYDSTMKAFLTKAHTDHIPIILLSQSFGNKESQDLQRDGIRINLTLGNSLDSMDEGQERQFKTIIQERARMNVLSKKTFHDSTTGGSACSNIWGKTPLDRF